MLGWLLLFGNRRVCSPVKVRWEEKRTADRNEEKKITITARRRVGVQVMQRRTYTRKTCKNHVRCEEGIRKGPKNFKICSSKDKNRNRTKVAFEYFRTLSDPSYPRFLIHAMQIQRES